MIDVVDTPVRIDGDHALAHRIERRHGPGLLGNFRRDRSGIISSAVSSNAVSRTVDHRAREFHPRDLPAPIHQFDLVALGRRFSASRRRKLFSTSSTYSGATNSSRAGRRHPRLPAQEREEARIGE